MLVSCYTAMPDERVNRFRLPHAGNFIRLYPSTRYPLNESIVCTVDMHMYKKAAVHLDRHRYT